MSFEGAAHPAPKPKKELKLRVEATGYLAKTGKFLRSRRNEDPQTNALLTEIIGGIRETLKGAGSLPSAERIASNVRGKINIQLDADPEMDSVSAYEVIHGAVTTYVETSQGVS